MNFLSAIIVAYLYLMSLTACSGSSPAGPAPTTGTAPTTTQVAPEASNKGYLIHLDPQKVKKFGLYYPVTYMFRLPPGQNSCVAQYKYSVDEAWLLLTEKKKTDLFNGINAVRFDYDTNFAYASISFSRSSDNIYLRFLDSAGQAIAAQFDSMPIYYDNRKAAVTITLDDWTSWSDSAFRTAADYLASQGLYFTVGLIVKDVPWSSVQQKIDQHTDKIEIASHGTNHSCSAAEYATNGYEAEIIGSRDAVRANLRYANSPYVSVYLEPCAYNDATVSNTVTKGDFLLSRGAGVDYLTPFVDWDPAQERYGRAGVTFGTASRADDANLLQLANKEFDDALATGKIYHLCDHPEQGLWHANSYLQRHIDHIKGRSDVWYVPLGPSYQYHYVQERRGDIAIQALQ